MLSIYRRDKLDNTQRHWGINFIGKRRKTANTNDMVFGLIRPGMNERYYTFNTGTLTITSTEVAIHEV